MKIGDFTLRDYQARSAKKAYNLLMEYRLAYLSMEVRTGKTVTSLTAVKLLVEHIDLIGESGRCRYEVLFVTKKKAMPSIESDYLKMGGAKLGFSLKVINYASLHKIDVKQKYLVVIVDEAHNIGAFPKPSQRTKKLAKLAYDSRVLFLSGTPSPESYSQLYHQFSISRFSPWAGYVNFYGWAKRYVDVKQIHLGYGRTANDYSRAKRKMVMQDVKKFFVTVTQKEADFASGVEETLIWWTMPSELNEQYQSMVDEGIFYLNDGSAVVAESGASFISKLSQLTGGTVISMKDDKRVGNILTLDKAKELKRIFEGKKIAIFYTYIAEYRALSSVFKDHTSNPEEFEAHEGTDMPFLSHVKSGSEGVKLSTADALVFYNVLHSSKDYLQARSRSQFKDRAHTPVYFFLTRDTIHEDIIRLVRAKQDFTLGYYRGVYGPEPLRIE